MALIPYSPWKDAASVGEGLGGSLTNLLLHLPQLRQQQELLRMHGQLYGAQADLYDAEARRNLQQRRLYEAQTGEVNAAEAAKSKLGDALWSISMTQAVGGDISPHVSRAVDAMARLPDRDRSDIAKNLSQMLQMKDPRFQQALGTGSRITENVPAGATLFNVLNQKAEYESPRVVPQGGTLFPTQGGAALAVGQPAPTPQGLGGAYEFLVDPLRSPLDPDEQTALAKAGFRRYLQQVGGTNAPAATMPSTNAPLRVRRYNPATGQLE